MPLPETLRRGSSAGVGAAQAALAWCPLLPMRMLLAPLPLHLYILLLAATVFFLGVFLRVRRKRRAVVNRRQ